MTESKSFGQIVKLEEVPLVHRTRKSKWRKIFAPIPEGTALMFTEDEVAYAAVYSALKHLHNKKEFLHFRCIKRKVDGKRRTYVIHLPHGDAEE